MRRAPLLAVLALLAACTATAPPPPAQVPDAQREVTARVMSLGREIDELTQRYEALLGQNAAIERLLARLGFTLHMSHDTVAQRVEVMRRFERAEAARTATYEKLKGLLKTLAAQHKVETWVEVRAGQIVVRIAEGALFDVKRRRLRTEAAPLVWAVADGLKELVGRRFEVVAEVPPPPAAKPAAARRRGKARRPRAPGQLNEPWEAAARRALDVVRLLEGAGIGADRLAAVQRGPDAAPPAAGRGRFIEIVVLPTRDELPRVHGAADTAAPPRPAPRP